jgi:hypothetical protein
MNQNFHHRVGYRTAEVIIGLDLDFDVVSRTKSLLSPIFFRRLNADLELGQLVLFQTEKRGLADIFYSPRIPELDSIFAERHAFRQFQ